MSRFIFKDATYDLAEADDLTFQEVTDIEAATGSSLMNGNVSVPGMIWISVRRKYPNTTWEDVSAEKFFKIEWLKDEEEERLPPTSSGANGSSTVDAPTELLAPTDTGSPG